MRRDTRFDHQERALAKARGVLLRDMVLFAVLPIAATWLLYSTLGGGVPWPFLPTFLGVVWAWMVWVRWRGLAQRIRESSMPEEDDAVSENAPSSPDDVCEHRAVRPNEEVSVIPAIRFNEEGDPSDSFIRQLNKPPSDEDTL